MCCFLNDVKAPQTCMFREKQRYVRDVGHAKNGHRETLPALSPPLPFCAFVSSA